MMLRWLKPTGFDRQIMALLVLYLLAIATSLHLQEFRWFSTAVPAYVAALLGIAATIGVQRWHGIKRLLPQFVFAVLSLLFIGWLVGWQKFIDIHDQNYGRASRKFLGIWNPNQFKVTTAASLAVAAVGALLAAKLVSWIGDLVVGGGADGKSSRVRVLIRVVVLLFVFAQVQKLTSFFNLHHRPWLFLISAELLFVAATSVICRLESWWMRVIVFVLVAIALILAIAGMPNDLVASLEGPVLIALVVWFLLLNLVPATRLNESPQPSLWRPGLPGLTSVVAGSLLIGFAALVNVQTVIDVGGTDGVAIGRVLRKLRSSPGANVRFEASDMTNRVGSTASVSIHAEFDSNPDPNYFRVLNQMPGQIEYSLTFENFNVDLNTKPLAGLIKGNVNLHESKVTSSQLADLFSNADYGYLSDTDLIETATDTESNRADAETSTAAFPVTSRFVFVQGIERNRIPVLIAGLERAGFAGTVRIHESRLSDEDWIAMSAVQGSLQFTIAGAIDLPDVEAATKVVINLVDRSSETRIYASYPSGELWQLLAMNIKVYSNLPEADLQQFLDALMAGLYVDTNFIEKMNKYFAGNPTRVALIDGHLVYDLQPDKSSIYSLYLPILNDASIAVASKIDELRKLSFDTSWLNSDLWPNYNPYNRLNLTPLSKLTRLEELFFPDGVILDDFEFLASLKNLRILQFDAYHDSGIYTTPNVSAKMLPNLERVVLFGEPHPKLMLELSKVETLKELVLVDGERFFSEREASFRIREMFKDAVQLKFLSFEDGRPETPLEFQEHRERRRDLIFDRRLPEKYRKLRLWKLKPESEP